MAPALTMDTLPSEMVSEAFEGQVDFFQHGFGETMLANAGNGIKVVGGGAKGAASDRSGPIGTRRLHPATAGSMQAASRIENHVATPFRMLMYPCRRPRGACQKSRRTRKSAPRFRAPSARRQRGNEMMRPWLPPSLEPL